MWFWPPVLLVRHYISRQPRGILLRLVLRIGLSLIAMLSPVWCIQQVSVRRPDVRVTDSKFDIGIIGSGIAGGALAAALKDSGLRVLLLDRRDGPLDTSRGDHIQPAVQPLLARWGFWIGCWLRVPSDALERDGLTPTGSILLRYRFPMSRALPVLFFSLITRRLAGSCSTRRWNRAPPA